jgi:hypothetical protein
MLPSDRRVLTAVYDAGWQGPDGVRCLARLTGYSVGTVARAVRRLHVAQRLNVHYDGDGSLAAIVPLDISPLVAAQLTVSGR